MLTIDAYILQNIALKQATKEAPFIFLHSHIVLLHLIRQRPGTGTGAIYWGCRKLKRAMLTPQVGKQLKELIAAGYLEATPAPKNRTRYTITHAGADLLDQFEERLKRVKYPD